MQQALSAYAASSQVNLWPDLGHEDTLELDPWKRPRPARSRSGEPDSVRTRDIDS